MSNEGEQRGSRSRGHTRARPPLIGLDQPGRLYVGNLMAIYGVSHSALYERLADGRLPRPDGRDGRRPYWLTTSVRNHIAACVAPGVGGDA